MDGDSSEAGFTLVEMMCAIFIIAIGLMALIGTFANSVKEQRAQRLHAQALRLATASVEGARQLPFSNLLGVPSGTSSTTQKGTTYTQSTSVKVCSASDSAKTCTTPATGQPTAVRLSVDVSWTDGAAQRHVKLGTSVTDGSTKLLPATGGSTSLLGGAATNGLSVTLGTLSLSPTTVAVSSAGVATAPVTASITVVGVPTTSSFPVTWADDTGSHQATMSWTSGTTWTATVPGSAITRAGAGGSVVFAATVPGSQALPKATLATVQGPSISGTCTVNPAIIALRVLSTVSASATTLSCTTTGLTAVDNVKVSWTTATGSMTATLTSTNGSTWTVVLPAGTQMRLLTVPFTFTPNRVSDGVSGTSQTVTAVVA